jgi:hypothetical protein
VHRLDRRRWSDAEIVAWSRWRQARNRVAKACHARRRRAEYVKRRPKKEGAL